MESSGYGCGDVTVPSVYAHVSSLAFWVNGIVRQVTPASRSGNVD